MRVAAGVRDHRPAQVRRLARDARFTARGEEMERSFPEFIQRTCELAEIPGPTFKEGRRAAWVMDRMLAIGLSDVSVDSHQNVVGRLSGDEPGILVMAHTDTVFGEDQDHRIRRQNGRLTGLGIGDNTIGVTAMLEVASFLQRLGTPHRAVWFAATTCEEGLGDLRGAKAVVDALGERVSAAVAVEGHFLGRVCTTGVGSRRWRITLKGSGGHSWHDYGAPSAVVAAAEITARLTSVKMPRRPRTTLNVARICGGEGINVIARESWLEIDLRSERQDVLDQLATDVERLAGSVAAKNGVELETAVIGDRPAASISRRHPLVATAATALLAVGTVPVYEAASTDANYPGSKDLPSICVGVTRGGGMHTPGEWIEEAPARTGLRQLSLLISALAVTER